MKMRHTLGELRGGALHTLRVLTGELTRSHVLVNVAIRERQDSDGAVMVQ